MGLSDYFKRIATMNTDQVRDFIQGKNPDEYNLIDVRQLKEYEGYHLPGARLIPLDELESRITEIDPEKPVITY